MVGTPSPSGTSAFCAGVSAVASAAKSMSPAAHSAHPAVSLYMCVRWACAFVPAAISLNAVCETTAVYWTLKAVLG